MDSLLLDSTIAAFFADKPILTAGVELLLKSLLILSLFGLAGLMARHLLPARLRHLILLSAFLTLILLPFSPRMSLPGAEPAPALFILTIEPLSEVSELAPFFDFESALVGLYAVLAGLLMGRVLLAGYRAQQIRRDAIPVMDPQIQELLTRSKATIGVKRQVTLAVSERIGTPVSFGLLRPVILLPARELPPALLEDVLLHELAHIRRLDWPVMLMAQIVACVFWINPLVWLSLARLNLEAENSCDEVVVNSGRAGADYARSLVEIARRCRTLSLPALLMQAVVRPSTLQSRIHSILENRTMKMTSVRKTAILLSVLSLTTLGLAGNFTLFGISLGAQAQQQDVVERLTPLETVIPQYPSAAAAQGIEGWVQVRFVVNAEGNVDIDSISVVDAEPAELFNDSAIQAISQFRFNSQRVNGQAVEVPNVQYVFRFELDNPREPGLSRSPPATR